MLKKTEGDRAEHQRNLERQARLLDARAAKIHKLEGLSSSLSIWQASFLSVCLPVHPSVDSLSFLLQLSSEKSPTAPNPVSSGRTTTATRLRRRLTRLSTWSAARTSWSSGSAAPPSPQRRWSC